MRIDSQPRRRHLHSKRQLALVAMFVRSLMIKGLPSYDKHGVRIASGGYESKVSATIKRTVCARFAIYWALADCAIYKPMK
jgi:hypothetical protein